MCEHYVTLSHTFPWGVLTISWAQRGPLSKIRDLCRHWWEGPSDLSVGEGHGCWERLPPTKIRSHEGVRILDCSRTPQSEVWAIRYGNLNGAMPRDNALRQQWLWNGTWDCQGLNNHSFLNFPKFGQHKKYFGHMPLQDSYKGVCGL
jgi:hypothetical protein